MTNNIFQKTIIIFYGRVVMGGAETLIFRLLKWYTIHNYRAILLTAEEITNEAILEDIKKISIEHYVYNNKQFISENGTVLKFFEKDYPLILTLSLLEFLKCVSIFRKIKYRCQFRHTLYIVHLYSSFFLSKKMNFIGKKVIIMLLTKGMIVFMEESCINECVEFYNLIKNQYHFTTYRLPIFIMNEESPINKNTSFNILSISRFEFPFKGYILGLINSFAKIKKVYRDVTLTIIGYGDGDYQVSQLVNSLSEELSISISIIGNISYSAIGDYIKRCDVYVGMGTTILDVANFGKIAIIAIAYQMSNLAMGFFHENPTNLGDIVRRMNVYQTIDELLLKVIESSDEEYQRMSKSSYVQMKQYYNIESIAPSLFEHTKYQLTTSNYLFIQMLYCTYVFGVRIVRKMRVIKHLISTSLNTKR